MQKSRSIISLLREPETSKARAIYSNLTRNAPKVRGHLTKYCSPIEPLKSVVSFTKNKFYFYAVVLSHFACFYLRPSLV